MSFHRDPLVHLKDVLENQVNYIEYLIDDYIADTEDTEIVSTKITAINTIKALRATFNKLSYKDLKTFN